jgi:prophage regulatory protein
VRILRRPQVKERIGLSDTTIYEKINPNSKQYDPTFPKPIKLGDGKNPPVGWIESEIERWIASRVDATRGSA